MASLTNNFINQVDFFQTWKDPQGNFLLGIRRDGCIVFQDGTILGSSAGEHDLQVMPADGTVVIPGGTVIITKPSIAAIRVHAPVPGIDPVGSDGNVLRIFSATNFHHVVTFDTGNIINPNGPHTTVTFSGAGPDTMCANFMAFNGFWYLYSTSNVSLS